ncbi:MAG: hypothetical protein US97_C0007G0014 [Microgenomates group bacterium GW2011_GWF1_38_5]|nr:MAG: hypothetical protein US97_C0007G0014 [Microgenomates group bacterium GW2011_GWF1_38_5]
MVDGQLSLSSGIWERDRVLDLLDKKYDFWLSSVGLPALVLVAEKMEFFTADDVWEELVNSFKVTPLERRCLGVVFRRAYKGGLIAKTGVFEKSRMVVCHAREKALWRSLLFKGGLRV